MHFKASPGERKTVASNHKVVSVPSLGSKIIERDSIYIEWVFNFFLKTILQAMELFLSMSVPPIR